MQACVWAVECHLGKLRLRDFRRTNPTRKRGGRNPGHFASDASPVPSLPRRVGMGTTEPLVSLFLPIALMRGVDPSRALWHDGARADDPKTYCSPLKKSSNGTNY